MLYKDAAEMVDYVSHALADASKEAAVLLYAPVADPFLEELARNADRVWYFEDGPRDALPRLISMISESREEPDHHGVISGFSKFQPVQEQNSTGQKTR